MSSSVNELPGKKKHAPYVPETMEMKEFTLRAVLIGLVMTAILGSANAYLGLKAGMTIAATYPAAVIGMALLRLMKGSLLEENIARTVGSIGESVAAGAIFTIPAFVMAELWPPLTPDFRTPEYWKSVALMMIGGTLGILFVTLLRRVMVEDPDLPYPESVAASEIHKAGQQGSTAAKILFANMGFGGFMYLLGAINVFNPNNTFPVTIGNLGKKLLLRTSTNPNVATTITGGHQHFHRARREPGVSRRGLHHWTETGCSELCRRRTGVGTAGSTPNLHDRPLHPGDPAGRSTDLLDSAGERHLFLDRAAHRRRWHAGRRFVHAVQDAQTTGTRDGPGRIRFEEVGGRTGRDQPHRARFARQGNLCGYRALSSSP